MSAQRKDPAMDDTATLQFDLTPPTEEEFARLASDLDDEERDVLLEHGTEAPFCGVFLTEKRPGTYTCRLCGLPLFHGGAKFESGTGWPSFTQPFAADHLEYITDTSFRRSGPRSSAPAAARTRAMFSPTARRRPASATASTR